MLLFSDKRRSFRIAFFSILYSWQWPHKGLSLTIPRRAAEQNYIISKDMALPLTKPIKGESGHISRACEEVDWIGQKQRVLRCKEEERKAEDFISRLPPDSRRAAKLASEKGASSWLTALPLDRHGFRLYKGAFRVALSWRYNWAPSRLPSTCVCGKHFSVAHALSCGTGGYAIMRHNELRDITARLMQEVCYDVSTEPRLQPLSNELRLWKDDRPLARRTLE